MDRFQQQVREFALQQQIMHLRIARDRLDASINQALGQLTRLHIVPEVTMPEPAANPLTWAMRWHAEAQTLQSHGLRLIQTLPAGPLLQLSLDGDKAQASYGKQLELWGRGDAADVVVLKDVDAQGQLTGYVTFVSAAAATARPK
jgi:hypothetical protein